MITQKHLDIFMDVKAAIWSLMETLYAGEISNARIMRTQSRKRLNRLQRYRTV